MSTGLARSVINLELFQIPEQCVLAAERSVHDSAEFIIIWLGWTHGGYLYMCRMGAYIAFASCLGYWRMLCPTERWPCGENLVFSKQWFYCFCDAFECLYSFTVGILIWVPIWGRGEESLFINTVSSIQNIYILFFNRVVQKAVCIKYQEMGSYFKKNPDTPTTATGKEAMLGGRGISFNKPFDPQC